MVGGQNRDNSLVTLTTERLVVGVDTAWSVVDDTHGHWDNSCANPDCQPFCFQGTSTEFTMKLFHFH